MPRKKKDSKKVKHHNQKQSVSQKVHVEVHSAKSRRGTPVGYGASRAVKHAKKTKTENESRGGAMMYPFGGSTLSVVNNIPEGSSPYQLQQMAAYANIIKGLQDEMVSLKLTNPKVDPSQVHAVASSIKNDIDEVVRPTVQLELAKPMEQNPLFNSPPESESSLDQGFYTPLIMRTQIKADASPSVSFGVQTPDTNTPILLNRPSSSMQQITQQTQTQMPLKNNSMSMFQTTSYLPSKLDEINMNMRNLETRTPKENYNEQLRQVGNTYATTYNDPEIRQYLSKDPRGRQVGGSGIGYYPQLHQTIQSKIDEKNIQAFGSGRFID